MKKYWHCLIGPVEEVDLDKGMIKLMGRAGGADSPPRRAAIEAIMRIVGYEPEHCWSGWGVDENRAKEIMHAACKIMARQKNKVVKAKAPNRQRAVKKVSE